MKISKYLILTSLLGLSTTTLNCMDADLHPEGAAHHAVAGNPQMMSWEGITHLMGVDMARARALVLTKVDAEAAGPTGVSWEGITHLMGVDMARAKALQAARAEAYH